MKLCSFASSNQVNKAKENLKSKVEDDQPYYEIIYRIVNILMSENALKKW